MQIELAFDSRMISCNQLVGSAAERATSVIFYFSPMPLVSGHHSQGDGTSVARPIKTEHAKRQNPGQSAVSGKTTENDPSS